MTSRVRLVLMTAVAAMAAFSWQSSAFLGARALGAAQAADQQSSGQAPAGRTATLLPDGRWLLVGGVGAERSAAIWDAVTLRLTPTQGPLGIGRAFHTATLLA